MSKVHIYSNKQLPSISKIEQKMRNYINAWNTNDLKTDILFDDLYQRDFHGIHEGKKINLRELKQLHTDYLSRFDQCRLIYFRKVGAYAYNMKLTFVTKEGGKHSIRKLLTVEDDKIGGSIDCNGTIASTLMAESEKAVKARRRERVDLLFRRCHSGHCHCSCHWSGWRRYHW